MLLSPRHFSFAKGDFKESYVIDNIYVQDLSESEIAKLEVLQAKAYILVPIVQSGQRLGVLAAYQNSSPRNWQELEVGLMLSSAAKFAQPLKQTEYIRHTQFHLQQAKERSKQEQLISNVAERLRQTEDLPEVLRSCVRDIREMLSVDRVGLFQFTPESNYASGEFVVEDVSDLKYSAMAAKIQDHCFVGKVGDYSKGKTWIVNDVRDLGNIDACLAQILNNLQVKASILHPLMKGNELWGLFAIHKCDGPRQWQDSEIEFARRISLQLNLALQQADYQEQLQRQTKQEQLISKVAERLRQTEDLPDVLRSCVRDIREMLSVDRVGLFQFSPESNYASGEFVVEDVSDLKYSAMAAKIQDHCFVNKVGDYSKGKTWIVNDVRELGDIEACLAQILENLQVKASILHPLMKGDELWGLFAIHKCDGPRQWHESEIEFARRVSLQLNLALQQADYQEQLQESAKQEQLISKISERLRQTEDLQGVLRSCVQDIRKMLGVDRVGLFQFSPESNYASGEFVVEDVSDLKYSAMAAKIQDHCFVNKVGDYSKGKTWIVNDVRELGDIEECLAQILENLQVKASILHPLMKGNELWGLFAIHKCDGPRQWHESEIEFARRISLQLNLALQQADYIDQLKESTEQLTQTLEREKVAKEVIQQQAIDLLMAVQPATAGDLTARAQVTEDEVGTIAAVYNTTLDSLADLVIDVAQATQSVVTVADASSSSIEELAGQAQHQLQQVEQAQTNIQAMVEATDVTTQNALKVGSAVERATASVESGDASMNDTVASIMTIRETVTEAVKRVERLSEASQKIAKVVSLIGGFANQTNLLALNAALEATRAGEYGKGFAVVADEVRNLAHQSTEATTEVEKLVQEVQFETKHVAAAMEAGIQQVMEGSELVTESRTSLNDIVAATAEITQLVAGITQAAERQMQTADSAIAEMAQVSNIASGTFEGSKDIVGTIEQLSTVVQELQARIGQFKVS